MFERTVVLLVERLYLGAGLAIVARLVALAVNEMVKSPSSSTILEVLKGMSASFIADYCVLFGLALLLVNFYVTATSQIEGSTKAIRGGKKATEGASSADEASSPASQTQTQTPRPSDANALVGEEAIAEARRFRRLVWFKVTGEVTAVALATCLSTRPGGGITIGIGTGAAGSAGIGVAVALITHAIFQALNQSMVSRAGLVTRMNRALAIKIMCADLAIASIALLSGLQMGTWSVGAAVLMLALGVLGASSSRHGLVTPPTK